MHNFVLKCFDAFKSFCHFLKIVCVFCIMMLLLFWIQNLVKGEWSWMGFIAPFLSWLLDVANNIYSISFELWGAVIELKYISAIVILVGFYFCINLLMMLTAVIEAGYRSTHFICKKTEEMLMNKSLKSDVAKEELKIKKYAVAIHTAIPKKYSHIELGVDINEQNKLLTDFIFEKLGITPIEFENVFLYQFDDFNKVDNVLQILFKVLHSKAPIDCAIGIQVGENIKQLQKLVNLKHYGKIVMASDTAYRYRFNTKHGFQISQIGLYQYDNRTIEVHEFTEFIV